MIVLQITPSISKQIVFFIEGFKSSYILRYLFYAHPIFLLILINFNLTKDKIFLFLFVVSIMLFTIVFAIATDWARFIHILYSLSLITFSLYYLVNDKDVYYNSGNSFLKKFKINITFANIFVVIYCLIWSLKHTYWQNHLSFAILKIFRQNLLYFNELIF